MLQHAEKAFPHAKRAIRSRTAPSHFAHPLDLSITRRPGPPRRSCCPPYAPARRNGHRSGSRRRRQDPTRRSISTAPRGKGRREARAGRIRCRGTGPPAVGVNRPKISGNRPGKPPGPRRREGNRRSRSAPARRMRRCGWKAWSCGWSRIGWDGGAV
jgi:hypothetical protein